MLPPSSHLQRGTAEEGEELSPFARMNPFRVKAGAGALAGGGQVGVLGNVYPGNGISTSKYSSLNFIPKNLFEQFRRVANFFFLVINVLQFFPAFQTINPWVASTPLIIIVFLTMVKDGLEDYRRHDSDNSTNNRLVLSLFDVQGLPGAWYNDNFKSASVGEYASEPSPGTVWEWIQWFWQRVIVRPIAQVVKYLSLAVSWLGSQLMVIAGWVYQLITQLLYLLRISTPPLEKSIPLTQKYIPPPPTHQDEIHWQEKKWSEIRVGDFVMVRCDEEIPADLIVLGTSSSVDSGGSVDNVCYVETKSLDGETNLKLKEGAIPMPSEDAPLPSVYPVTTAQDCSKVKFWIESEPPSANMHGYQGMLCSQQSRRDSRLPAYSTTERARSMSGASLDDVKVLKFLPLSETNLLLRGTVLRDTTWVIGMAVFTGNDTKVMRNAGPQPSKRSWIEREMNYAVICNLTLLGVICLITAVYNPIWTEQQLENNAPYVDQGVDTGFTSGLVAFLNAMIQYQNFLPISLYLTVEIVKTAQAYFIRQDRMMYYAAKDKPCVPRSWNLSDDLGQIEYVFSDKTGTLTRNVMEFKASCINGVVYHDVRTQDQVVHGEVVDRFGCVAPYSDSPPVFYVAELAKAMSEETPHGVFCVSFFKFLAVCHSVLIAKDRKNVDSPSPEFSQESPETQLQYRAQSPDEAALVKAAKDVGITFVSRETDTITIDVFGQLETYQVLQVLEFNSDRKRMSVVVRRPGELDSVTLLCKGADSVILERIQSGAQVESTNRALDYFAREGLRTLCLAYRVIPNHEYEAWADDLHEASVAMVDRDAKVADVQERLERGLTLLGCTAIEDKLQEGVPECIRTLLMAGIKIWVLTGDKMETAINIGISCNLLDGTMELIVIRGKQDAEDDARRVARQMQDAYNQVVLGKPGGEVVGSATNLAESIPGSKDMPKSRFALVIDGVALKHALEEPVRTQFLEVGRRCASVICCRVSPLQKAEVLRMVKMKNRALCLAIGDGANDVSMIQAADIGVGIEGEEGVQAVASSDYSFGQFRFLSRLLLVHGRWNYHRTAEMLLNFFYKNFMTTMPLFLYQFYCGFSNQFIFDPSYVLFSQTLFTALPVMALGAFDRDLEPKYALSFPPAYYERGIRQELFTRRRFWQYTLDGFYQSLVCFYIVYGAFDTNGGIVQQEGWVGWLWEMGTYMFINCIWNANFYVLINNKQWSWPILFSCGLSTGLVFVFVAIYSTSDSGNIYGLNPYMFGNPVFWACFVMSWILCMLPRYTFRAFRAWFDPWDQDVIMEMQKYTLKEEYNTALATVCPPKVQVMPLLERGRHWWQGFKDWWNGQKQSSVVLSKKDGMIGMDPFSTEGSFANSLILEEEPADIVALGLDKPANTTLPRTSVSIPVEPMIPIGPPPLAQVSMTPVSPSSTGTVIMSSGNMVPSSYRSMPGTSPISFLQDMSENTRTAHRGFSFSQSQGASVVILGNRGTLQRASQRAGRSLAATGKVIARIITLGNTGKSKSASEVAESSFSSQELDNVPMSAPVPERAHVFFPEGSDSIQPDSQTSTQSFTQ
jgi:phospholipid-translocating ATPase